jgi:preprotein translocase subunit Sss1
MIKNLKPEHKVFLLGLGLIIVGLTGFILNL